MSNVIESMEEFGKAVDADKVLQVRENGRWSRLALKDWYCSSIADLVVDRCIRIKPEIITLYEYVLTDSDARWIEGDRINKKFYTGRVIKDGMVVNSKSIPLGGEEYE